MKAQTKQSFREPPFSSDSAVARAKKAFDDLVQFCLTSNLPFGKFEAELMIKIAALGCCLIHIFLTARNERLDLNPHLKIDKYRAGDPYAERTLNTVYGKVRYCRQYLQSLFGGNGIFPLDIELGLTQL